MPGRENSLFLMREGSWQWCEHWPGRLETWVTAADQRLICCVTLWE